MKTTLRALFVLVSCGLLFAQPQGVGIPQMGRNNPNGIWESPSGTKYNLQLSGENLLVKLEGSNPPFLQYELTLAHNKDDVNRYKGAGFFRATLKSGKECRFETEWEIMVVSEKDIVGSAPRYLEPNPETCTPKEKIADRIELIKK